MSMELYKANAQARAEKFFADELAMDYKAIINLENRPLSYSSLKHLKEHPAQFIHNRLQPFKGTEATIFGNLAETVLQEPDMLDAKFSIAPWNAPSRPGERSIGAKYMKEPKSTDDFKKREAVLAAIKYWEEFDANHKGKMGVTEVELDKAYIIKGRVENHRFARKILLGTEQIQRKVNWIDKDTGLPCVAIYDFDGKLGGSDFICDLKVMDSASPRDFQRRAMDLSYDLQEGVCMNSFAEKLHRWGDFYHIVCEKEPPYAIAIYKSHKTLMEYAKNSAHHLLMEFKYCYENNLWHETYEFRSELVGYNWLELPSYIKFKEGIA